ncbi:tetraspanin [Xylariaceae sp. FL0594]|nr:tetraspanin [Xylariaceae sp. FL0594]
MVNKVLAAYIGVDILFAATGALILGFSVIVKNTCFNPPNDGNEAARDLLYQQFPFSAGIGNGIFTFVAFAATLPALATNNRSWLKLAAFLIVVDAIYTLVIGLDLWIFTLRTKDTFGKIWLAQPPEIQGFMQTAFNCCGYLNSTSPAFQLGPTCPSPAAAALMTGCAAPLSRFSNTFIDNIFTAVFGVVGVDAVLVIATACLLKERKEMERFRHIDEKSGARGAF